MKPLLILMFATLCCNANAQKIKDFINQKKQEAKEKVNARLDQKGTEAIDSAMVAPEKIIKKKKDKKAAKKAAKEAEVSAETVAAPALPEGAQNVIETNILCEAGKVKIEGKLKKQPGVYEINVNTTNGDVTIRYNSGSISYNTILLMITNSGFIADDNKPAATAITNPCKKSKG